MNFEMDSLELVIFRRISYRTVSMYQKKSFLSLSELTWREIEVNPDNNANSLVSYGPIKI